MKMDEETIRKVSAFKYLGTHVSEDGELDCEIIHRIQCGWNSWRKLSGVLSDRKISARLKRQGVQNSSAPGDDVWE